MLGRSESRAARSASSVGTEARPPSRPDEIASGPNPGPAPPSPGHRNHHYTGAARPSGIRAFRHGVAARRTYRRRGHLPPFTRRRRGSPRPCGAQRRPGSPQPGPFTRDRSGQRCAWSAGHLQRAAIGVLSPTFISAHAGWVLGTIYVKIREGSVANARSMSVRLIGVRGRALSRWPGRVVDVGDRLVTVFLCGDVMTGRGVDQVLPGAGQWRDSAGGRLRLALGGCPAGTR